MKLMIVESPAKSKTIEKYLGKDWRVVASVGHVRDLEPIDGSVDTDNDFAMKWAVMKGKEKQIKIILDELKKADELYLASDQDREGESIAWHVLEILKEKKALKDKKVYRVTFNEITKKAVMDAIAHPREIDMNLVDAYLVRRALDYLIGFKLSPVLWRKNIGKSAGRVQSVAVSLVVMREAEIEAFKPVEYWSLDAMCIKNGAAPKGQEFKAALSKFNNEKIDKMTIENKEKMFSIISALTDEIEISKLDDEKLSEIGALKSALGGTVSSIEKKKSQRKPAAPFTTSTLQQEAARKLRFSSKRTMSTAQKLYEQGLITYMRTDATNLSTDAVVSIREYIASEFGDKFLPKSPNIYATKSKNAQEAHEAIRPTTISPQQAAHGLPSDEGKLYDLIWKRTVACQMTNAEFDSVIVDIDVQFGASDKSTAVFHAVGTTRTFDGFLKVYAEGHDDDSDDDKESKLPPLATGDAIDITELLPQRHFTAPPPRYTEASLVKKLEELGIGRPSTYAAIMSTIVDREYVKLDKQRFFPTESGWLVAKFLEAYFSNIINVDFTAKTEDTLDDIANGENTRSKALDAFWKTFYPAVESAKDVPTPDVMREINKSMHNHLFPDGNDKCPGCGTTMELKVSKYGPFLGCANYPDCKYTKRLENTGADNTRSNGAETSDKAQGGDTVDLGDGVSFKVGRFGPYVTDGSKNASARGQTAQTITIDIARELLSGPKKAEAVELGTNPATGKPVLFYASGKFGPYISSNKVNVSVKEQPALNDAIELINNKKSAPKTTWKKRK